MKYRILRNDAKGKIVAADGGRPAQRYAHVAFAPSFSTSYCVRQVAGYVSAVREATKLAKAEQVNGEVNDASS